LIQLWSAITVALLTVVVGPLLRGEASGLLVKRITSHAALREKLGENIEALKHLDALLVKEFEVLKERETYRLTRKVNGGNVAALVLVALVGGTSVYGLISATMSVTGAPVLYWLLLVLAVIVGFFSIALAAVGLGALYAPPKAKVASTKAASE
jgi:predicted small lipoprotein YifL